MEGKKVQVSVTLEQEDLDWVEKMASEKNATKSGVMRCLIKFCKAQMDAMRKCNFMCKKKRSLW